jgi:hypothetical protein
MELRLLDIGEPAPAHPAVRAADLLTRCLHVAGDGRLETLGYRFYPMPDSEVPSFFAKRFSAGRRNGAVTLLAGIDPRSGDAVADDEAIRATLGRASWWLVRLTYGARMITLEELTGTIARRDPAAFAAFADELDALSLARRSACPVCARG